SWAVSRLYARVWVRRSEICREVPGRAHARGGPGGPAGPSVVSGRFAYGRTLRGALMPCNGWQHSPDCDCGWGGIWHGNVPSPTGGIGDDSFHVVVRGGEAIWRVSAPAAVHAGGHRASSGFVIGRRQFRACCPDNPKDSFLRASTRSRQPAAHR